MSTWDRPVSQAGTLRLPYLVERKTFVKGQALGDQFRSPSGPTAGQKLSKGIRRLNSLLTIYILPTSFPSIAIVTSRVLRLRCRQLGRIHTFWIVNLRTVGNLSNDSDVAPS